MAFRHRGVAVMMVLPLAVLTAAGARAPQSPAFDVVSIRALEPSTSTDVFTFLTQDAVRLAGDRLQATNISALGLIHAAYRSEHAYRDQILGADGWIASERFDLDARAPYALTDTPTSMLPPPAALMLRRVLQERFQLRVRQETRPVPRLVLTYAHADRSLREGLRMSEQDCAGAAPARDGPCGYSPMAGNLSMRGRPLQTFVDYLSRPAYAGGRVVDETAIAGTVDIDLEWMLDWNDLDASRFNLRNAVREQLGLTLEDRRLLLPVLIIEHIERPSPN